MNTTLKLFLHLSLCSLLLLACSNKNEKVQLTSNGVILAYGDSLTKGVGARNDESYPSVLADILGVEVINKGIPGETSSEGLLRLNKVLESTNPDLVILCHGGNDILRKLPSQQLQSNLESMIDTIHTFGAEVILVGVPKPAIYLSTLPLYEDIADEYQLVADVETLTELLGTRSMKSDTVHLNAKGYYSLAQALAERIQIN